MLTACLVTSSASRSCWRDICGVSARYAQSAPAVTAAGTHGLHCDQPVLLVMQVSPLFVSIALAVGICGYSVTRNLMTNPAV